jgi:hypothetical protein
MTRSVVCGAVAAVLLFVLGSLAGTSVAAPGTVTGGTGLSAGSIDCTGFVDVTVTLAGQNGTTGDPADIVLALDRSSSVSSAFTSLKNAAKAFVDRLDLQTDGVADGVIANGNRVGLVSFAAAASVNVALTSASSTNAAALKTAINGLASGGGTNAAAGISTAQTQLAGSVLTNTKKMVVFSDGRPTQGGNGVSQASAAKTAGTEIFTVGFGSPNTSTLNAWASDPDATHAYVGAGAGNANLNAIVNTIGPAVTVPAATDITVVDTVSDHFTVSNLSVTAGSASVAGNAVTWTVPTLGSQTVSLTYRATHLVTAEGGIEPVRASITYADAQGKAVSFPSPTVEVTGCPVATTTCTPGVDCELPPTPLPSFATDPITVTSDAGPVDQTTQLSLFSLTDVAPPPGVCPGFEAFGPGAEITVLPLSDRLVVTVDIPKSVRQLAPENGISHINVCVGTNLSFSIRGGGTAILVGGVYYGLIPDCPKKPASPCMLSRKSVGGGARLVWEARAPFDPKWWSGG